MFIDAAFPCLIHGAPVTSVQRVPILNPATEEIVTHACAADAQMLNAAVAAAGLACASWRSSSIHQRQELLATLAAVLRDNAEELATLLTIEQGKPLAESRMEIELGAVLLEHSARMELEPIVLADQPSAYVERHFTPLGVVAGILPWNFPLFTAAMKVGPALVTGNAIIIKPAPTTPLATLRWAALCAEATPPGLLQVLADDGTLGQQMVEHPGVHKISFTGSTRTGKNVMRTAAGSLKRLTLELGGNDPAIVFPDVDPKATAASIFATAFMNCGQLCTAIKRLYVHEDIHDQVCGELVELAGAAILGDGLNEDVTHGPVQNRMQYDKVRSYIDSARQCGRILVGGTTPHRRGYFVHLTIVTDIPDTAPLVAEEQFGPVLPVLRFRDEDDVVRRANDSRYGLTASVWSRDLERARRVARRLEAGTTWINKHLDLNPSYPMGFCKESGIGVEFGEEGLRQFVQPHLISQ